MHTTKVKVADLEDVLVHHNADWSGDARVSWTERDPLGEDAPRFHEFAIPGRLLVALSRAAALDWVKGGVVFALEDMKEMPL